MTMDADLITITELGARTGVNPVTLRAWERRYGLLKPERSSKGYRLYDAQSLERVRQIVGWVEKGVAISRVRELLDAGYAEVSVPDDDEVALAAQCLRQSQWRRLEKIFDDWLRHYPLAQVVRLRLAPLMLAVQQESPLVARALENALTSFAQQKFAGRLLGNLPGKRQRGVLVVVLEDGPDLFALSLAALLKEHQLPALYQMYGLPPDQLIVQASAETLSGIVMVVPPTLSASALQKRLGASLSALDKPVWVVGPGVSAQLHTRGALRKLSGDPVAVAEQLAVQAEVLA